MNAVVLYEIELPIGYNVEAESLMILEICKDIERRLGRTEVPLYDAGGNRIYTSRPIDIDILLLGREVVECKELTIPHKLMWQRDFVMDPLLEIADAAELEKVKRMY